MHNHEDSRGRLCVSAAIHKIIFEPYHKKIAATIAVFSFA